jgi:hypothetical protein
MNTALHQTSSQHRSFADLVDIGSGRKLYLECQGSVRQRSCWSRVSPPLPIPGVM